MKKLLLFFLIPLIYTTSVKAQTWQSNATMQTSPIENISVSSNNILWASNSNPADGFSISNNGGATWTYKSYPTLFTDNNFLLGMISAVNENLAYIIVSGADTQNLKGLYKTTDAGNTWTREVPIFNDVNSFPNHVHFWDANNGVATGDGFEVFVYQNGNWYTQSGFISTTGTYSINTKTCFKIVGDSVYFLTNIGTILKSVNKGISWTELNTPFTDITNLSFDFKDDLNGLLSLNDASNQLYQTTDGGATWALLGSNIPNLYRNVKYIASLNQYISTGALGLSYSNNDGATWVIDTALQNTPVGNIATNQYGLNALSNGTNVYTQFPDITTHPDYNALVDFYNNTNGATLWNSKTNWLNPVQPISNWLGITEVNGRVTEINLPDNNIVPSNGFPLSLTTMPELTKLDLWMNNPIYSAPTTLPIEIQNLTNLEHLDLRGWQISGNIPSEIGNLSNLTWLDLRNNKLTGNIPVELTTLNNLYVLVLTNNLLNGNVPDFSGITGLTFFWHDYNKFEFGDIENNFVNNQSINSYLYSPQFKIDQPYSVAVATGNSTILTANTTGTQNNYQWFKEGTLLTGETNATLNVTINSPTDYGIYTYQVTNNIVTGLTLQSNNFTIGDAPSNNSDYASLVALYNSTNGNNWTTNTNWLDNTKPLNTWHGVTLTNNRVTSIALGNNNLTGVLPTEIGNFTELQNLWLWANQISGTIPAEIGSLSNLVELDLAPNTFTGSIPTEIGNLTNLEVLWLNQNGLSGNIPQSFQNLLNLRQLYLIGAAGPPYTSSAYSGDFPDLTALPLEVLSIDSNHFTFGDIADEFATYQANIANFVFSPQYTLDIADQINANAGDNILLTLTDVPATTATGKQMASNQYQWYKDNVVISGANANSHTISNAQPADNGYYTCTITNTDNPGMEILRAPINVNVGTLSITDETHIKNLIKIYPVPTNQYLNISTDLEIESLEIIEITGKSVININNPINKINVSHLAAGTYFIKLNTIKGAVTKRIIKK